MACLLVAAPATGTVTEVNVVPGDDVSPGTVVARLLDDTDVCAVIMVDQRHISTISVGQTALDSTEVRLQQLKVDQAETNLESLLVDLEKLRVQAPGSGTVVRLDISPGSQVAVGAPLAAVADYRRMDIVVNIDELEIAKLSRGQKAQVQFDALPGNIYEGEITEIALEGTVKEGVTTYAVTVQVDNADGRIRGGMTASATVVVERREGVLVVPAEAVEIRGRRGTVHVLVNDQPEARPVEIGLVGPRSVEITTGLAEGEQVVVSGASPAGQRQFMPGFMMPGGGMGDRPRRQ